MHRKVAALGVVLIILFSAATAFVSANSTKAATANIEPSAVSSNDWPMLEYNAAHTCSPDSLAPTTYDLLWRFNTLPNGGGTWVISSSPAIVGGVLYVGADDGCFYALDAVSGSLIWNQTLGSFTVSSPAIVGGIVYVSVWEGRDYALNASTGSVIWNSSRSYSSSSPTVVNGLHYICSGSVIARNASTGITVWETSINGGSEGSPVVADNTVYTSGSGYVYALDALNGSIKWHRDLYISGTFNAPAVANGLVYVECSGDIVYALDANTGAQVWSYNIGANSGSTPTVADGIAYFGSLNKGFFALNATTGAKIWNSPVNSWESSFGVAGGVTYACDDSIHALNAYTGAEIWRYNPSNIKINSAPAIANGILYVKGGDSYLYAFGKANQSSISVYPKINLAGSVVTVSGAGFTANSAVSATFGEQPIALTNSAVDSLGHFSGAYTTSSTTAAGIYQISVTDNSGHVASANFTVASAPTTSWPMFMHDLEHSGTTDNTAAASTNLLWKFDVDMGEISNSVSSSAAVVGGIVYDASQNGYLYALDAYTGVCYWRFNLGDSPLSSPVVVDGVVYMGCMQGICAINAYTGAQLWKTAQVYDAISTPAISGGMLYVGTFAEDTLYAFRISDGQLVWKYTAGDYVNSSPAVAGNTVYVGSDDGCLYAFSTTGTLEWKYNCSGTDPFNGVSASPIVVNGVVYVASQDGNVFALDCATGSKIWNHTTSNTRSIFSSPTFSNGAIYISTDVGVYALNAANGDELWLFSTSGYTMAPPTVAGGVVYVGANGNNLYAIDASSGSELWHYQTDSIIVTATAISQGVLYVGTGGGSIYAIGTVLQTTPTPTQSPSPSATATPTPTSTPPTNNNPTTNPSATPAHPNPSATPQPTSQNSPTPTTPSSPANPTTQATVNTGPQQPAPISATLLIAGGIGGGIAVLGSVGLIRYNRKKLYAAKHQES